jgi:hypothetical protein
MRRSSSYWTLSGKRGVGVGRLAQGQVRGLVAGRSHRPARMKKIDIDTLKRAYAG